MLLIFFPTAGSIRKERKTKAPDQNFQLDHFFLNNGVLEVGVNLIWGGAIDYISYYGSPNIVDRGTPDPGRAIQISLWDGDDYYSKDCWRGEWGWNPVQAGDRYLKVSGVIEATEITENLIYTKCCPLEWGGSGPSDIILEQWVSLEYQAAIKINYKVFHFGDDYHAAARHEFPCVYLKTPLIIPDVVVYQGEFPWTKDMNVEIFQQREEGLIYSSENWVSLVDYDGYGITLYTQTEEWNRFNAGRVQREAVFPLTIIQAHTKFDIEPQEVHQTTVFLIFGHWQEAREIIYTEHFKKEAAQLN